MNKTFKGEYVSFLVRLAKRLTPVFFLILFVLFKLYFGRSAERLADYRNYFLVFFVVCVIIGIYYHTDKIRTVVNEINISDNTIQIIGQDFTSRYQDKLEINKTMLEIQEEELGKNKSRLCLEIYSDDKFYYLNKFNDWQYSTLAEIVDEYKLKTGKSVSGMEFYSRLKESK